MYKILYLGVFKEAFIDSLLDSSELNLSGFIIDPYMSKHDIIEHKKILEKRKIKEVSFDKIVDINPDIVLVNGYSRIIKSDLIDKFMFINVHAGILPKWRGLNSNCWAIINGEEEVGYSIHRVRDEMDSGELYVILKERVDQYEYYWQIREHLQERIHKEFADILINIIEGDLKPQAQISECINYTTGLRKSDGVIMDWNKPSFYIYGLYRVFGTTPHTTGLSFVINNKKYEIMSMDFCLEAQKYYGVPGAVLNTSKNGGVFVKTQDSYILINRIRELSSREMINASKVLRIGMRLGESR